MKRILPLDNPVMEYDWGSRVWIPELLGQPTPSPKPQAEMWMGAHPKAPSRVGKQTLLDLIENDPPGMLGASVVERFEEGLPFLFKLLAADTPLSIQAHPDKKQAEHGFAAENAAGIDLHAPARNYRDANHKPEIVCALTEFWLLNGFRELSVMLELLDEVNLRSMEDEIRALRKSPDTLGLRNFFNAMVDQPGARRQQILEELLYRAQTLESVRPEYRWILRIAELHPDDIGVLSVLMLNLIKLEPGQAVFCAAGDLHAYLDGFSVELMANSDNVLRGGLTHKHIDTQELMKTLTFRDGAVQIIDPVDGRYPTPAEEFELSVLNVGADDEMRCSPGFEIMVNVDGHATVSHGNRAESVQLPRGASVAIPAAIDQYAIRGPATLYIASVPDVRA